MEELLWRKYELMRMRWQLSLGRTYSHPLTKPAALDWLDGEIEAIKRAIAG